MNLFEISREKAFAEASNPDRKLEVVVLCPPRIGDISEQPHGGSTWCPHALVSKSTQVAERRKRTFIHDVQGDLLSGRKRMSVLCTVYGEVSE